MKPKQYLFFIFFLLIGLFSINCFAEENKPSLAVPDDDELPRASKLVEDGSVQLTEEEHKLRYLRMQNDLIIQNQKQIRQEMKEKLYEATKDKTDYLFVAGQQFSRGSEGMKTMMFMVDDLEDNYLFTIGYLLPPTKNMEKEDLPDDVRSISYRELHILFSANIMPLRINNFDSVKYDFCKLGLDFGVGFFYDWQTGIRIKTDEYYVLNVDFDFPMPNFNFDEGFGMQIIMIATVSHVIGVASCRSTFGYTTCFVGGGARF